MALNHESRPLTRISSFITRRCGARFEAELFAAISQYPFVIRSFEFAPADGAIFATPNTTPPAGTLSERFWQLNEEVRRYRYTSAHWARLLVLFDVKSKISVKAEDQIYVTPVKQRERVAFYLGVCATNPDYVELIPNYRAGVSITNDETRYVAVNISRKSLLPPSAYGYLSPCNSPYRMPLALLPEALACIQRCAQGCGTYTNPWTRVAFPDWTPHLEHSNDGLIPEEASQHYTSFKGLMEIWRGIRVAKSLYSMPIDLEFMWLQPRLADFKLIVPCLQGHLRRQQLFVQYKIDGLHRSPDSPLTRVAIARNSREGRIRYYFDEHERFDYLLYQFDYQDRQKLAYTQFFFIPEVVLPNEFYETEAKDASFDREDFKPYWITMDHASKWVEKLYSIIQETPHPRQAVTRPSRLSRTLYSALTDEPDNVGSEPCLALPSSEIQQFAQNLFYTIMAQCATRRSGLVLALSRWHPHGDLAYCRYQWTHEEQEAFFNDKNPPCTITQLPPNTSLVPFHLYARSQEGTSRGPRLTTPEFQRLNECSQHRLLVFDAFSQDGRGLCSPLLVVPTSDVSPTQPQLDLYASNRKLDKTKSFEERVPLVAELLHTGLTLMDYVVSNRGPRIFEDQIDPWGDLWVLLNNFAGVDDFTHPHNYYRRPSDFRVTVQDLHQCLVEKHARTLAEPMPFVQESDEGE